MLLSNIIEPIQAVCDRNRQKSEDARAADMAEIENNTSENCNSQNSEDCKKHAVESVLRWFERYQLGRGLTLYEETINGIGDFVSDYWLWDEYKGNFSKPKNGLFLQGSNGCSTNDAIEEILDRFNSIECYTERELMCTYNALYPKEIMEHRLDTKDLVILDVGTEDDFFNYKNALKSRDILDCRYRLWKDKKILTIITTSLYKSELISRLGDDTFRRIKRMCSTVRFKEVKST